MLRLLSPKAQGRKDFRKPSKPSHVSVQRVALAEDSQMSTHVPGFQSFFRFLHHFLLAKLATASIRVNHLVLFVLSCHHCVSTGHFIDHLIHKAYPWSDINRNILMTNNNLRNIQHLKTYITLRNIRVSCHTS